MPEISKREVDPARERQMTSEILRLGEKLSSIQTAAKPEGQHPPGAPAAAAASPDQHATAIRGCAGERAGAGGPRAGSCAREEQVAAEPSAGLPRELSKDRTCSLRTRSSSSTPAAPAPPSRGDREGEGAGGEGGASGAQGRGGGAGEAGRVGDGARRTPANRPAHRIPRCWASLA